MKIPKSYRLLPVVGMIYNMRSGRDTAHRSVMVVKTEESCAVPIGRFDLYQIWRDFFDYVLPVHIFSENRFIIQLVR